MKNRLSIFLLSIALTSCQLVETYKGKEAIQLVQQSKFGVMNVYSLGLIFLVGSRDPTNLELANIFAESRPDGHFSWAAEKFNDKIYIVYLKDEKDNKGIVWEADLENKIVRCITCDPELMKRYHLSTDTVTAPKTKHKRRKRY
jgi:hypothetical protein